MPPVPPPRLSMVHTVRLPRTVLDETARALRVFGARRCEGLVLWVGRLEGECALIEGAFVPEQKAIQSENGVGYFVEGPELFAINRHLSEQKLRLLAQVHSHPTEAYHSSTDDRYALVTAEGGFSLVVPDFARGPADLGDWAVYRLRNRCWIEVRPAEVRRIFALT